MRHLHYTAIVLMIVIIALAGCGGTSLSPSGTSTSQSTSSQQATSTSITATTQITPAQQVTLTPQSTGLQHIFFIMMENHSTNEIFGNTADAPYLNQLANTYGISTSYYGVTHPSLPNYLAALSGDFQGIWDDCPSGATVTCEPQALTSSMTSQQYASASARTHLFHGQTLVDQLETHSMTWKAYMQSLPSPGFTGGYAGLYGEKHDPFMYFASIRDNPNRLQRIVPFTQFNQDIQAGTIPNFVWISPDVCNDMHGDTSCSSYDGLIVQGDNFIHSTIQTIMASSAWKQGSAIIITWDENDASQSGCCHSPVGAGGTMLGGGHVPLIVISSQEPHHIILNNASYNHYTLLATIEYVWNLGCLANTCGLGTANLLAPLFH